MRRILKGLLIALLILVGLSLVIAAALILPDSIFPDQRVTDFSNVTYPGPDGVTLHAYLAQPVAPAEPQNPGPAILLIHEFFGLNQDLIERADLLAEQGYTVLAVDAYRGKTTRQIARAIWLLLTTPQGRIDADIDAGYAYLSQLPGVDPGRVGAVGFCFGGTQAMLLGRRNPELAANVIFYGRGLPADPIQLGSLGATGPVLGIFGEKDASIPLQEVYAFEDALQQRGIFYRVSIYPGVGHAFVHAEDIATPGPAQEAWNEMLVFLAESLKPGT